MTSRCRGRGLRPDHGTRCNRTRCRCFARDGIFDAQSPGRRHDARGWTRRVGEAGAGCSGARTGSTRASTGAGASGSSMTGGGGGSSSTGSGMCGLTTSTAVAALAVVTGAGATGAGGSTSAKDGEAVASASMPSAGAIGRSVLMRRGRSRLVPVDCCTASGRYWHKADIPLCTACPLLGVKRTCLCALQMSAYDPKRTCAAVPGLR